ncbi:MAG: lipoate-protein ligase A related protein [Candidatus Hydrogenedentota bacterium]|nr:MAG: lipoate-protein ligase A related protein [Candidatus Hydrogenedentota bacterium]
MQCWDYTHADPAMNLALDEALLQHAESESHEEVLRFWESEKHFVVLGLTQSLNDEVHVANCAADNIPIHRRCSAGGCVLQGPGCLNFTLILDQEKRPDIRGITSSYSTILKTIISSLQLPNVIHTGISDLAINGRKISGNAQRRRKRFILHHGTLLFNFDTEKIPMYLQEPAKRPDYRGDRTHAEFVQTLTIDKESVKAAISTCYSKEQNTFSDIDPVLRAALHLKNTKYSTESWIHRK